MRRFFRRAFLSLRPGGRLLLEPQPWASYVKKKKLTPRIWTTFQQIQLLPERFPQLLVDEIGFLPCQLLGRPQHAANGFNRQLQLFTKPGGVTTVAAHQRKAAASPADPAVPDGSPRSSQTADHAQPAASTSENPPASGSQTRAAL
ncbi:probable RNA methyltransferase CG1239 [Pollicipes pollicipes]|uniref:probable RNA methyltransferase CG1239 n=1 Tax=Pollicipes pollicipes TaxID=41117 RepID=UPI001884C8C7|nr:probable RNA methyltransferase CG1239 [Pollicipes pollicipes]